MAIKATVFKAALQIADMDRHYFGEHSLTLARHPSETDERMMVRLLAFALYAGDALIFANGMSSDEEPDLWQKDLTGSIELWIEVGLPDERAIRRASGRSDKVVVISYGRAAAIWWNENSDKLQRLNNLTVLNLATEATQALAALASRNMQMQCTVQEGHVMVTSDAGMIEIEPMILHGTFHTN
jgi:uncharacterized protein YaeQ